MRNRNRTPSKTWPNKSSKEAATEIPTEKVATPEVNIQFFVGSPESGRSISVPSVVGSPGYNINLARQVAMGSQLRLRFEQENQTKNLKTLLEAEVDMKKAAEAKNAELAKELDSLCVHFSDVQVSNNQLAEQVEQRFAEMDARLDKISVDFNEELYPHMLTAIAGRHWVIGYGLRLAVMKCAESSEIRQAFADVVSAGLAKGMREGLNYGIKHGKVGQDLADIEAYDPEANSKLVKSLQDLKDLKYLMVDPLKSSSQLKIPVYPEVRDPKYPWVVKEEMLLEDAIMANINRAEKKKKCRVVCHTHGIGFAHHTKSDGIPVSAPTVVPQGLTILLSDAATQTEAADKE
ncbi:hypothetical protein Tco_0862441 [Tanacetum coccineum]